MKKTSQELLMLSSVTFNSQVPMNVMNWGSKLSEMATISQKFTRHVFVFVFVFLFVFVSVGP